jgi:hypothetical protein
MCKDVVTMMIMIMIMIMQNMDQDYGGVQGTISIETEGSIKFCLGFRQFGSVRGWVMREVGSGCLPLRADIFLIGEIMNPNR